MDAGLGSKHLNGQQNEATRKFSSRVHVRIYIASYSVDQYGERRFNGISSFVLSFTWNF